MGFAGFVGFVSVLGAFVFVIFCGLRMRLTQTKNFLARAVLPLADIEDINKIMGDMHRILETKASQEDLNTVVTDQAIINESLCTENIVGRWTWKSGQLSSKNMIPWESQVVNTLPDNFIYQKDSPYILSVAPGLYEVKF